MGDDWTVTVVAGKIDQSEFGLLRFYLLARLLTDDDEDKMMLMVVSVVAEAAVNIKR